MNGEGHASERSIRTWRRSQRSNVKNDILLDIETTSISGLDEDNGGRHRILGLRSSGLHNASTQAISDRRTSDAVHHLKINKTVKPARDFKISMNSLQDALQLKLRWQPC